MSVWGKIVSFLFVLVWLFSFSFLYPPKISADWTVDVTPPRAHIQIYCPGATNVYNDSNNGATANCTANASVLLFCEDSESGCSSLTATKDGASWTGGSITADGTSHTITAVARDNAGNTSTTATAYIVFQSNSISGFVYVDFNHDCTVNGDDTAYISSTANLTLSGSGSGTRSSGLTGYSFTDLFAGSNYIVTVSVPTGYTLSTGTGCSGNTASRTLTVPPSQTGINFYITPYYQINGYVYGDSNGSNAIETSSDTTWSGRRVTLSNGQYADTNGSGYYAILDVISGSYTISTPTPTNYKDVVNNGQSATITNASLANVNFLVRGYEISGTVYVDFDHDCTVDAGTDTELSGATVTLGTGATYTTAGSGNNFAFVYLTANASQTTAADKSGYVISSCNTSPRSTPLGPDQTGIRFYLTPYYQINGFIYGDSNGNDSIDTGSDTTWPSRRVTLSNGQYADTNGSGYYAILNVISGSYTISTPTPTDYKDVLYSGQSVTITNASLANINFLVRGYKITGTVYLDNNHNCTIDGSDTTFNGATLTLSTGPTKTSGASGYSFTYLTNSPPNYTVAISNFSGYTLSSCGSNTTNPRSTPISGADVTGVNFYLTPLYTITGSVFKDTDYDGTWDSGETAYTGASFTITSPTGSPISTNTSTGTYTVGATASNTLVSGTYRVQLTIPSNYEATNGTCSPDCQTASYFDITVGPSATNINFGITNYSITGNVYTDYTHDCIVNTSALWGDDALTGSFTITSSGGTVSYPSTGVYTVSPLTTGTYTVTIGSLPSRWVLSPCTGNTAARSIPVPPNRTPIFNPPSPSTNYFMTPTYNITGRVITDYWHNQATDAPDVGYNGATLTLSGAGTGTTTTNSTGAFAFNDLYTGAYTVTLTVPAGYVMSMYDTNAQSTNLNADRELYFYITPLYSISGNIFDDKNKSRCKDGAYAACTATAESNYTATTSTVKMIHQVTGEVKTYNFTGSYTSTTIASTLISGSWRVEYSTLPTEYKMTHPLGIGNASFTVVVGKPGTPNDGAGNKYSCDPSHPSPPVYYNTADCWHDTSAQTVADNSGSIRDLNFGITNSCPWATFVGSDVRIDSGVDNCVPDDGFPTPTPTPTPPGGGGGTPTPTPTPSCGSLGLACCGGSSCTTGLTCIGTVCSAGPTPTPGTPPACGSSGVTCCAPSSTCNSGLSCIGGLCTPTPPTPTPSPAVCGGNGQLCCAPSSTCNSGLSCTASGVCAPGVCPMFTSVPGSTSYSPGLIISGNSAYSFCLGGICPGRSSYRRWILGGPTYEEVFTPVVSGVIRTSYDYISTTAFKSGITLKNLNDAAYCGSGGIASCVLDAALPNGIYKADGNLTLFSNTTAPASPTSYIFPANKQFVILVNGNLQINGELHVPTGSTLLISTKGSITVDENVGTTYSSVATSLEGFFSAGTSFDTGGNGGDCTQPKDKRLNISGAVVVNANGPGSGGTYMNKRDMCEDNLSCPSYTIKWRSDFIFNAPEIIKHPNFIWQEVAP